MTEATLHDAQALTGATYKSMLNAGACTRWLSMRVEVVAPGYAWLSTTARLEFLSGHRTCHGGFILMLTDPAFAFACNSHNHNTMATGYNVEFLRPTHGGDTLTVEATEQVLSGRHGIYDIHVTNQVGEVVVMFRGKSARIRGQVIPVPGSPEPQSDIL